MSSFSTTESHVHENFMNILNEYTQHNEDIKNEIIDFVTDAVEMPKL